MVSGSLRGDAHGSDAGLLLAPSERLRLFRAIFEESIDAIGVIGLDGRYLQQNAAHRELTGYADEELPGLTPAAHLGEEQFQRVLRGLESEGRWRGEVVSRTKDGRRVEIELSAFAVKDRDGFPLCFVGIKRDISARKAADEEVRAARAQLALQDKLSALGSLVSGVAHEIRTPLTYIATNVALAEAEIDRLMRPEEATRVKALLREAYEGVDRVNHLVTGLRRFTRARVGSREDVRVDEAVRQAVDLFQATQKGHMDVVARLDPTPPVRADRIQVQQVVLNLLQNAAEAVAEGGVVEVTTSLVSDGVEIRVRDHGPGIPREAMTRIFDPFYTTKERGTGLGLSIVRRIVDEHGGTIRLHEPDGGGAEFRIVLPLARNPHDS